jgi:hypothetical protein
MKLSFQRSRGKDKIGQARWWIHSIEDCAAAPPAAK